MTVKRRTNINQEEEKSINKKKSKLYALDVRKKQLTDFIVMSIVFGQKDIMQKPRSEEKEKGTKGA